MGTLFWIFSHISGYFAILVLALALSSGLYMLSVLAEEFPTITGKILRIGVAGVFVIQILLWIDGLPAYESLVELCTLGAYAGMLINFPFINLFSIATLFSLVGFIATNIVWLQHFLKGSDDALSILGFFVMMVWAVPCGLVASLTINDYTLPTQHLPINPSPTDGKRKSTFRSMYDFISEQIDKMTAGLGGVLDTLRLVKEKRQS
jgi:hypothetical protein